jgi:hypothetical protein
MSHIHASDFANRYLAGTLSEAERAAYEPEVIENDDTLRELEATARLKVGLARLRESGELDELLRPTGWSRYGTALAAAAAVAVVAVAVMLVRFGGESAARPLLAASMASIVDQRGSVLPVGGTIAVFRKRVASYDATIRATPNPQAIELRVLPETTIAAGQYRVSLARLNDQGAATPVASIERLRPAADGFVSVFVDSSRLAAGDYQLEVSGEGADASTVAAGTFRLHVQGE